MAVSIDMPTNYEELQFTWLFVVVCSVDATLAFAVVRQPSQRGGKSNATDAMLSNVSTFFLWQRFQNGFNFFKRSDCKPTAPRTHSSDYSGSPDFRHAIAPFVYVNELRERLVVLLKRA